MSGLKSFHTERCPVHPVLLFSLRLFVNDIVKPWLIKKASAEVGRVERFLLMFAAAALITTALSPWVFDRSFWIVVAIGFMQAFGTYAHWRAYDISMSKTSLYTWGDDIIAMLLAMYFLGEAGIINLPLGAGIICSLGAIMLFSWYDASGKATKEKGEEKSGGGGLWFWVLGYSVLWGAAFFAQKYFAVQKMSPWSFFHAWYWGALVTALLLFLFIKKRRVVGAMRAVPGRDWLLALMLGASIFCSNLLTFNIFEVTPLIVAQPIILILEMAVPALIGLLTLQVFRWNLGFSEARSYSRFEWGCFALGVLGVCLIAVGYTRS